MAVNGGGGKYHGIDLGLASFRAARRSGWDSSCRRPLWLWGRRPAEGDTVACRLSEQWTGRGVAAWRAAGPALACCTHEAAGQARPEERGAPVLEDQSREGGVGVAPGGGSRPGVRPKEEERWEKEGKKKKGKREKKKKKRKR
jgi:hypothetical protein